MKLFKLSIALLACLSIFSCSSDDESKSENNVLMSDQSFSINAATLMGISMEGEGHSTINLINVTETQTKTLTIDVESFTKETIEGTYSYPTVEGDKVLDDWLTNYAISEGSEMTSANLENGVVSITHNGSDNYTIEMDLTMVDGVTFDGTYTGDFTVMFMNN